VSKLLSAAVKADRPSKTAEWVAVARSLGSLLPPEARLANDPYGARFSRMRILGSVGPLAFALFRRRFVLYMQVRTRVLDDALLAFVRDGGAQVVLLGAGFDCRALRFARELEGVTVFEVDHPATQARKREVLRGEAGAKTEYVAWNFEEGTERLPSALAAHGHDASRPTLTIWEGVAMYLTDMAIDATFETLGRYSAPGSKLAFTYIDRRGLERPTPRRRIVYGFLARIGEPFRFGWRPDALADWLGERGFRLDQNRSMVDWSRELLPEKYWLHREVGRYIAIATRAPTS
jgi:methyltransferase (TIGR00027 family)